MPDSGEQVSGLRISVARAPGYEPPGGIGAALEQLAEAIRAEAERPGPDGDEEVAGFALPTPTFDLLGKSGGKFGPRAPLQNICVGGFECNGYVPPEEVGSEDQTTSCSWVYWD